MMDPLPLLKDCIVFIFINYKYLLKREQFISPPSPKPDIATAMSLHLPT